jgi:hypothetical protein
VFSAELVRERETDLIQSSAENHLPSPAECLAIVASLGPSEVNIEVVRESHLFPEFTPGGVSRWATREAHAGLEIAAAQQGLMTYYELSPGATAIVGPGLIHRIRCAEGGEALKILCAPSRSMTVTLVRDSNRRRTVRGSRITICL